MRLFGKLQTITVKFRMENKKQDTASALKEIISHAKEYGFVFPSSEIYDGLQAVYDYGQNGVELKNNLKTV